MDELSSKFMLVKLEMELEGISDPAELRKLCVQLARMVEAHKQIFKSMFNIDIGEQDVL